MQVIAINVISCLVAANHLVSRRRCNKNRRVHCNPQHLHTQNSQNTQTNTCTPTGASIIAQMRTLSSLLKLYSEVATSIHNPHVKTGPLKHVYSMTTIAIIKCILCHTLSLIGRLHMGSNVREEPQLVADEPVEVQDFQETYRSFQRNLQKLLQTKKKNPNDFNM